MACDYRKSEYSNTGVSINGKWHCNKHLTFVQCAHGNTLDEIGNKALCGCYLVCVVQMSKKSEVTL